MPKPTGLTERCLTAPGKPVRPCDSDHMRAANAADPSGISLSHRGFTTPAGEWLEVWWQVDVHRHVTYVYEDTRGLNRR